MKRLFYALIGLLLSGAMFAASGIDYDGTTLNLNNDFTRTQSGTMGKKTMPETSGMACSRTTTGYLWAHGDENTGSNKKIIAIKPDGTLTMTLNISGDAGRDDWEDIATGVYDGKNYLFIGAFGDNNLEFNDQYYIYYFEEPAIKSGSKEVSVNYIRFGYPDNKAHNTETLMYDNIEHMLYIVDKVDAGNCALFSLPFKTDYGTGVQRLTKVCDLGTKSKFELACGGDISPDGKWMAIKNKKYVLLWERQGEESLSETAQRRPVQVAAYEKEEQGESLAWEDSNTFYTTSDSKKDTPIYKYVRGDGSGDPGEDDPEPGESGEPDAPDPTLKEVHEVILSNGYSAYINEGESVIRGWYVAGTTVPSVAEYKISEGATWSQDGNTVTVTAQDKSAATYTLDVQPVTPVEYTTDEIVFEGSESSWVKGAYGWDDTKKWRFSKTDDDYSREIAGRTHVELFLPACDTVDLFSMSKEREVRFYVNGKEIGSKTKLLVKGNTLVVEQNAPFMLSVVSAQSSGDGGIASIRMARKLTTGVESIQKPEVSIQKVIVNGQLTILYNGQMYDVQGRMLVIGNW